MIWTEVAFAGTQPARCMKIDLSVEWSNLGCR